MEFYENKLKEKIQIFNGKDIFVRFIKGIDGHYIFHNAQVEYRKRTGYLYIRDSESNAELKLFSSFFQDIDFDDNKLTIQQDNDLDIEISIK